MTNIERVAMFAFIAGNIALTAINYWVHRMTRRLVERKLEEMRAEFDGKIREILKKSGR
jgi:hypothetical protein